MNAGVFRSKKRPGSPTAGTQDFPPAGPHTKQSCDTPRGVWEFSPLRPRAPPSASEGAAARGVAWGRRPGSCAPARQRCRGLESHRHHPGTRTPHPAPTMFGARHPDRAPSQFRIGAAVRARFLRPGQAPHPTARRGTDHHLIASEPVVVQIEQFLLSRNREIAHPRPAAALHPARRNRPSAAQPRRSGRADRWHRSASGNGHGW